MTLHILISDPNYISLNQDGLIDEKWMQLELEKKGFEKAQSDLAKLRNLYDSDAYRHHEMFKNNNKAANEWLMQSFNVLSVEDIQPALDNLKCFNPDAKCEELPELELDDTLEGFPVIFETPWFSIVSTSQDFSSDRYKSFGSRRIDDFRSEILSLMKQKPAQNKSTDHHEEIQRKQLAIALKKLSIEDIHAAVFQSSDPKKLILSLTQEDILSFEMASKDKGCSKEILGFDGWGNNKRGLGSYDSKNMFFESYAWKSIPSGGIYEQIIAILRKPFIEDTQDTTLMQQSFEVIDDKSFSEYSIHTQTDDLGCWLKRVLPTLGIHPTSGTGRSAVCCSRNEIDLATLTQIASSLERIYTQNQLSDVMQMVV